MFALSHGFPLYSMNEFVNIIDYYDTQVVPINGKWHLANQDLGARCDCCYWDITVPGCSQ